MTREVLAVHLRSTEWACGDVVRSWGSPLRWPQREAGTAGPARSNEPNVTRVHLRTACSDPARTAEAFKHRVYLIFALPAAAVTFAHSMRRTGLLHLCLGMRTHARRVTDCPQIALHASCAAGASYGESRCPEGSVESLNITLSFGDE